MAGREDLGGLPGRCRWHRDILIDPKSKISCLQSKKDQSFSIWLIHFRSV